jgi:hypothetical protein
MNAIEGPNLHIDSAMPRLGERMPAGGSTYESANRVGSHPADAAFSTRHPPSEVDGARHAALSALRNDRFGTMLEKISDPQSSGTLALAGRATSGVNFQTAASSYAENSD